MKLLVLVIALFSIFSCVQTPKVERQAANESDPAYQPDVPTQSNPEEVAENLICRPRPSVPASPNELIIKIHLNKPIAHLAEVRFAGEVGSSGLVSVYTRTGNAQPQLQYTAPTNFGKEPVGYASEMRGTMQIPGASEAGWISVSPNMKKSYFGFGDFKYSGGYTGAVYLSKLGASWYQAEGLTCEVK